MLLEDHFLLLYLLMQHLILQLKMQKVLGIARKICIVLYAKKNTENEKKILKNENTKKIQNSKINQKNSLFTIISVEEHCKKIKNIENQQKNPKNKITKKIKNKKINKNICESSTLQKKDFTTKKIQKPENLLEHNFFYLLSENQGKQKTIQNEKHNRKNSNIICNI